MDYRRGMFRVLNVWCRGDDDQSILSFRLCSMLIRILSPPFPYKALHLRAPVSNTIRCYVSRDKHGLPERKKPFHALDEDNQAAYTWLQAFTPQQLPKGMCEVTFSRSGGPGGQNVNKYGIFCSKHD
jgi:hypothetical protein